LVTRRLHRLLFVYTPTDVTSAPWAAATATLATANLIAGLRQKADLVEKVEPYHTEASIAGNRAKAALLRMEIDALNEPEVAEMRPEAAPAKVLRNEPSDAPTPRKKNAPKINAAQVWGRAKRRQTQDDAVGAKYWDGGYGRLPNAVRPLIAEMPAPCLKVFTVACLLANNATGKIQISMGGWAKLIGSGKGKNRHKHAERAVRRVCDAGLMVQESRGSARSKDSNEYRLLPLTRLDLERAKAILGRPLTKRGRAYERDRRSPVTGTGMGPPQSPSA
jgi:hypothetical protein